MMEAVQCSNARLSATELMRDVPPKPKPSYLQRLIRTGTVQRAYTALRDRMAAYSHSLYHYPQREDLRLEH
jgi:hypothetical protein